MIDQTPWGKKIVDIVYNVFDVMAVAFEIIVPITWYPNILILFGVTNGYGNVKFSLKIILSTVILTDGQIKKYDMLLKVHNDTPINITNKSPIIKAKQEKVLKREDIKQENISQGKRNRIQRVV